MTNFKILLFVCMFIQGGYGQGNVKVDPEPPHSSVPPQPTTTPTPNVTTTISPNTTTAAPNTTTVAPITTSVAPNTTTAAPNTTTAAPNTTTAAPNTTTAAPITTSTVKPTPTPAPVDPKVANWTVNYVNSTRSCIILAVAAQFEVLDAKNKTIKINIPADATGSGTCESNKTQTLVVSWAQNAVQNNSVEFNFEATNNSKFDLSNIVTTLYIPGADTVYKLTHNKSEFATPLKNSYKCARTQTLDLTKENSNVTVGHLHVSHLQYQAFHNSTEPKFDSALDCETTSTPDIVPIVVGCVLAALVVAVLVAYLFGRRRCQARGYLSIFSRDENESRPLVQ